MSVDEGSRKSSSSAVSNLEIIDDVGSVDDSTNSVEDAAFSDEKHALHGTTPAREVMDENMEAAQEEKDVDEKAKIELEEANEDQRVETESGQVQDVDEAEFDAEEEEDEEEKEAITDEDILYSDDVRHGAIANLIFFSILMFTLPVIVMYVTYKFVFLDHYHLPRDEAALYAGLCAAATVIAIAAAFVWKAIKEEQRLEIEVQSHKKVE
ncbi:Protein R07E5.7 [Aphelenchoides avenae]|nr:Protein R07E5.7 [Aphelenchus avenae]